MKTILKSLFLASVLFFAACNNAPTERPKTPEELRAELKQQEQSSPGDYLSIIKPVMERNQTREAGLFHDAEYDGWIISGQVKNAATIAKFKDLVVRVQHFSQTNTVIDQKDYVIYEFYEPNTLKEFELKVYPPDAAKTFAVTVLKATPVE